MLRLSLITIFTFFVFAQDQTLSIQGVLRQPSGKAVSDGNYSITFNFYNIQNGGAAIASKLESVDVKDGLYTANIDITGIPFNEQYWVGVQIGSDNESTGTVVAGDSLRVEGSIKVAGTFESDGTVELKNDVHINGELTISSGGVTASGPLSTSDHILELAKGLPGKEFNAGKITYDHFGTGALEIHGAGTDTTDRKIKMLAEGGMETTGNIKTKTLSFNQGGNEGFRIIHGFLQATDNNVTLNPAAAATVTVTYIGNDEFDIYFKVPFTKEPTVVVSPLKWHRTEITVHVEFIETGRFRVARFHNGIFGDGVSNDIGLTFIVIGN